MVEHLCNRLCPPTSIVSITRTSGGLFLCNRLRARIRATTIVVRAVLTTCVVQIVNGYGIPDCDSDCRQNVKSRFLETGLRMKKIGWIAWRIFCSIPRHEEVDLKNMKGVL